MDAHIFFIWDPDFLYFWEVLDMENTMRELKNPKGQFYLTRNEKKIQKPKKFFCSETKTAPVLNHMIIEILKIILFNYKKLKSLPIPGNTDWNAFENNVNSKHQNRLKQSYEIENKKCRLRT